jgi:hypothetical protein
MVFIVYQKAEACLLKCSFIGRGVFHAQLPEESQAKFEELELSGLWVMAARSCIPTAESNWSSA